MAGTPRDARSAMGVGESLQRGQVLPQPRRRHGARKLRDVAAAVGRRRLGLEPQWHSRRSRRPRCRRQREARSCSIGAYTGLGKEQSTCANPSPRTTTGVSAGASSSGSALPSQGQRCLAPRAARPTSVHPSPTSGAGPAFAISSTWSRTSFTSRRSCSRRTRAPVREAIERTGAGSTGTRSSTCSARSVEQRFARRRPTYLGAARRPRADRQHDDGARPALRRPAARAPARRS